MFVNQELCVLLMWMRWIYVHNTYTWNEIWIAYWYLYSCTYNVCEVIQLQTHNAKHNDIEITNRKQTLKMIYVIILYIVLYIHTSQSIYHEAKAKLHDVALYGLCEEIEYVHNT